MSFLPVRIDIWQGVWRKNVSGLLFYYSNFICRYSQKFSETPYFPHRKKWLAWCLVNLHDLSHGTVVLKITFPYTSPHSSPILNEHLMYVNHRTSSKCTLSSKHSRATMGAYGRVRFVVLCTVYILELATQDNIAMAFTTSSSGILDLVVLLTKNKMECDVYSCSYRLIIIPTRLRNRLPTV